MRDKLQLILLLFLGWVVSCRSEHKTPVSPSEIRTTENAMVGVNRIMVKKDEEKIRAYLRRNNLTMQETPTGLWYSIQTTGKGEKAKTGDLVSLRFKVSLLDGTYCYSSDSTGLKEFRLGHGGVESGLEEGMLMLRLGDKATFILPPHLAYGFPGDGNKIPRRAILVYHVELLKKVP